LLEARVLELGNAAPDMAKDRESPLHDELRQLLLERRQRAKLTQEQLATLLGWGQRSISKIERGRVRVTVAEFIELARALGFDAAAAIKRLERRTADKSDS
jgi:transcriptional regulator with XRE-family HTH domain